MNTDAVVVDTVRELRARDEREQVVIVTAMTALMQQQMALMAAVVKANEQAQPVSWRR
jgi:hypothetical protein